MRQFEIQGVLEETYKERVDKLSSIKYKLYFATQLYVFFVFF